MGGGANVPFLVERKDDDDNDDHDVNDMNIIHPYLQLNGRNAE